MKGARNKNCGHTILIIVVVVIMTICAYFNRSMHKSSYIYIRVYISKMKSKIEIMSVMTTRKNKT
jgi:hypothetical protein